MSAKVGPLRVRDTSTPKLQDLNTHLFKGPTEAGLCLSNHSPSWEPTGRACAAWWVGRVRHCRHSASWELETPLGEREDATVPNVRLGHERHPVSQSASSGLF